MSSRHISFKLSDNCIFVTIWSNLVTICGGDVHEAIYEMYMRLRDVYEAMRLTDVYEAMRCIYEAIRRI